jgi:FimV-like protein
MQRDAATNFAVSSGLATVVRQQIDARLELAAAYVDLGDAQRARQLLAQTLIDGDEAQRRTAQSLLNRLAQDR